MFLLLDIYNNRGLTMENLEMVAMMVLFDFYLCNYDSLPIGCLQLLLVIKLTF